ncbi:hypothetical protein D6D01_08246, partial [Aureobasidium pullulans]
VILANGGSVWFEKALLGNFSEAKQDILDLGDDDDPDAVCALIKHLYGNTYHEQNVPFDHGEYYDNHLTTYTIGDKYDSASLRQQALTKLLRNIECELIQPNNEIPDLVIHFIQKIRGPSAIVFGDKAIQTGVCHLVSKYVYDLWNNKTFAALLIKGDMLDEKALKIYPEFHDPGMCKQAIDECNAHMAYMLAQEGSLDRIRQKIGENRQSRAKKNVYQNFSPFRGVWKVLQH